jgi:hypothetical protein
VVECLFLFAILAFSPYHTVYKKLESTFNCYMWRLLHKLIRHLSHSRTQEVLAWRALSTSEKVLLPLKNQTVAIASKPKTAALVYDRIWSPFADSCGLWLEVPEPLRCYGGTPEEQRVLEAVRIIQQEFSMEWERKQISGSKETLGLDEIMDVFSKIAFRDISDSFRNQHSIFMVPVYDSGRHRDKEYVEGERQVVVTTLSNLQIVDEDKLTWDQVLEFREDKDACHKYRVFVHWLDKDMVGRPQHFIEDEIAVKLKRYEDALVKHGIKTILGSIEEVLDGKYLMGAAGMGGSLALAGHPTLGLLASTGLIVGKVGVKLGQTFLDSQEVEHGQNCEVSWVYEVEQMSK